MTIHPEIVKKAQAELDLVVGDSRLPELSDRDSLPYIDCIVKEVLRCAILHASIIKRDCYNVI